jgi:hypothetical protein
MRWFVDEQAIRHWTDTEAIPIVEDENKWARISGLSKAMKQRAWHEINANCPPLADLLRDPEIQDVVRMFDAEIYVDSAYVPSLPAERLKGRDRS